MKYLIVRIASDADAAAVKRLDSDLFALQKITLQKKKNARPFTLPLKLIKNRFRVIEVR